MGWGRGRRGRRAWGCSQGHRKQSQSCGRGGGKGGTEEGEGGDKEGEENSAATQGKRYDRGTERGKNGKRDGGKMGLGELHTGFREEKTEGAGRSSAREQNNVKGERHGEGKMLAKNRR